MQLRRFEDWHGRLAAYLAACRERAFEWGAFDCALFAAGAVEAMTGHDFAAAARGQYASALGASKVVREMGFANLPEMVSAHLGTPLSVVAKAQRGDVVQADEGIGGGLGVVDLSGNGFVVLTEAEGLKRAPLARAVSAWRV